MPDLLKQSAKPEEEPPKPIKVPGQRYMIVGSATLLLPASFFALLGLLGGGGAWWLDLFNHFWAQYAIVFVITTLVLSLALSKKLLVVSLVMLGLSAWQVGPLYWSSNSGVFGDVAELELLHFNVNTEGGDPRAVARYISRQTADLVFLQEVDQGWLDELEGNVGPYELVIAEPREDNFGIACYVRSDAEGLSILEPQIIDQTNGYAGVPAIELEVELETGDTPITVPILSLHTLPPVSSDYAARRDAQLKMLEVWSKNKGLRAVVIGDLNTTPWSAPMRELLNNSGLQNSQVGYGVHATWPAGVPGLMRIPIDHCLHGGSVATVDRRIGESCGSDHLALHVRLRFAGEFIREEP